MILLNEKYYKNAEEICKNECYIFIKFTQSNKLIILGVTYINQTRSVKAELEKIEETLSIINNKYKSAPIFLGGDFNARIKNRGTITEEQLPTEAPFDLNRESLDQIINKRGQELLNFGDRNEFFIVNGRFTGDQPAKYTYVGTQGSSVIDLVLYNVYAIYLIKDFKVLNIVTKSSHFPVVLELNLNLDNKINEKNIKWLDKKATDFYNYIIFDSNVALTNFNTNKMYQNIIQTIYKISKDLKMISVDNSKKSKKKPWFDAECNER